MCLDPSDEWHACQSTRSWNHDSCTRKRRTLHWTAGLDLYILAYFCTHTSSHRGLLGLYCAWLVHDLTADPDDLVAKCISWSFSNFSLSARTRQVLFGNSIPGHTLEHGHNEGTRNFQPSGPHLTDWSHRDTGACFAVCKSLALYSWKVRPYRSSDLNLIRTLPHCAGPGDRTASPDSPSSKL